MKIRMLTSMAGPSVNLSAGDPHDCDAAEAKSLIAAGYAEPWTDAPLDERAVDPQPGKETRRARRG